MQIEAVTKSDDCFAIIKNKPAESKHIEISTSVSLEVQLFCCETGMLTLDAKWLPSKFIKERHGSKNVVI